ncbi:MAG: hypothetical protein M3Q29_11550 [Chloroflexota bacterium]|nr:hypothetical protein [Chloroflexota bacterium]
MDLLLALADYTLLAATPVTFFNGLYKNVLLPVALPIGIIMLFVGIVMFATGHREGQSRITIAGLALFLLGFGPWIATTLWNLTNKGL